jgi:hypothetical protein
VCKYDKRSYYVDTHTCMYMMPPLGNCSSLPQGVLLPAE